MTKNYIFLVILLSIGNIVSSQIQTRIDGILVNSQTYSTNCQTVTLGSPSTNSLSVSYTLTRDISRPSGRGTLRLKFKRSSNNSEQTLWTANILDSWWSNLSYSNNAPAQIDASLVAPSGSFLFLEFEPTSGSKSKSCNYPLGLQPSFALLPTSSSILCGDVNSQRTFTVSASNVPSGATVTYNWSHVGWTLVSSTPTTRTLRPSSGTTLPSTVSVTPILNNVSQPPKTSTVSRAPVPNLVMAGNRNACVGNTEVYSISNNSTNATINWTISNTAIASFVGTPTNTAATIRILRDGVFEMRAKGTNACGQAVSSVTPVYVGIPARVTRLSGPSQVLTGALVRYDAGITNGAESYGWQLPLPFDIVTDWNINSPRWQMRTTTIRNLQAFTGTGKIGGFIRVWAINRCGNGEAITLAVAHSTSGGGGTPFSANLLDLNESPKEDIFYPNPADINLNIYVANRDSYNYITTTLLTIDGKIVFTSTDKYIDNISTLNLPNGIYVLNILTDKGNKTKNIVIKH